MTSADIVIVGAGMAGASLAAALAPHASVLLLEAEDHPGYHSTGRSAAFWSETYGGPFVQPLTTASGPFLAGHGLLKPRGSLHIAEAGGAGALDRMHAEFAGSVLLERIGREGVERAIPGVSEAWTEGLLEPSCADIDVAALHALYLRSARQSEATLLTRARLESVRKGGRGWMLETTAGAVEGRMLVDAAGAWADPVARLAGVRPLGIQPYRRTLVQLRISPEAPPELPLVIDSGGRFYFKPEAGGRLWLSPHDESACEPCDCAPEEMDVATAIDRLEAVVDWKVERVERSWAGLRTFAPDRRPVYGFDPGVRDFVWVAGQGGFGIQTAPAAAALAAALILGEVPEIDPEPYRPGRFMN